MASSTLNEDVFDKRFSDFKNEIKEIIKEEMKLSVTEIINEFNEVKKSIQFLNEKYEEVQKENKGLNSQISEIKQENAERNESIKNLEKENQLLTIKVDELENMTRLSNLELHGVPVKANENLDRVIISLLKIVEPKISQDDVESSFRLKKSSYAKDNKPTASPIVVKFKSKATRMHIIMNKKKLLGHNFHDINIDTERVYINENLIPNTKALFYKTNIERKQRNYKFIWTRNGAIKVRKDDNSTILTIKNLNDLNKL